MILIIHIYNNIYRATWFLFCRDAFFVALEYFRILLIHMNIQTCVVREYAYNEDSLITSE